MGTKPLFGKVVVDISTSYAGPFCSMLLGDLGATVIKVEKPGGDDCRTWGPPFVGGESAWFLSVNRNKQSVCLDFSKQEGLELLYRLMEKADVFLENLKPTSLKKFGLDYESVSARFPRIIYAAISGFGLTGPESTRTGYDLIAQAMSGLMSVTGGPDGEPQRVSTALSDIVTGITTALGITAKLVERETTGKGGLVDVGLLDVDVALMSPRISSYLASRILPVPNGGVDSVVAIYQKVKTADEPIVLATGTDFLWKRFKQALRHPESLEQAEYQTNAGRQEHRVKLIQDVEEILKEKMGKEWIQILADNGVPASRIHYLDEVVVEPQILARGMLRQMEHPIAGSVTTVGSPIHLDGQSLEVTRVPPVLGQHTHEVMEGLGFHPSHIAKLEQQGVIFGATRHETDGETNHEAI